MRKRGERWPKFDGRGAAAVALVKSGVEGNSEVVGDVVFDGLTSTDTVIVGNIGGGGGGKADGIVCGEKNPNNPSAVPSDSIVKLLKADSKLPVNEPNDDCLDVGVL